MKQITRYSILVLAVITATVSVMAADGDGGYAGAFTQVPIGARPTAMGGAYIAVANDGAAPLYNPAGLATLKRPLFASSYRLMELDRKLGYVTFVLPTRLQSAIGINWLYAGSGEVEARNSDGDPLGTTLSQSEHLISIVFAKRFERYFSAGIRMGYLHSKFWEMSATSVGFDFGGLLYLSSLFNRVKQEQMFVKDIRIGVSIRNVGAGYKWNSEKYVDRFLGRGFAPVEQDDSFPMEIGLGVSGRLIDRKLLLAVDAMKPEHQDIRVHAGGEYFISPEFALRTGFSDGRFAAGTGYVFKLGNQVVAVDYAFTTDKADEGSEHIFSFDILF